MSYRSRASANERLAAELAAGKTVKDAAAAAELRSDMMGQAAGQLAESVSEAVETLRRAFRCGHPAIEVRAALGILDKAIGLAALADLQAEVEELRGAVGR